jgi:hypothetical protein
MRNSWLALPLVLLLPAAVTAQSFYMPSDTPAVGTCNAFPFNTTDMRYQALVRTSELGSTPQLIRGFALAPCTTGIRSFSRITVKMAHLASPTLSTTFDSNIPGAVTVYDAPNAAWHMTLNTWNEIDLQRPFLFNGTDNLVVDFIVLGSTGAAATTHRDATHQRVYLGSYTGQLTGTDGGLTAFKMRVITGDASLQRFGAGCMGSNSQTPGLAFNGTGKIGTNLSVDQANAVATRPTLLVVGTNSALPVFPLDLAPFGAPGCVLYIDQVVSVPMVTTANGTSSLPLTIPNDPALVGLKLYFQWANLDTAANALGVTTSNYGRALLGN